MVTEQPRHQTYPPLRIVTASRRQIPVLGGQRIARILGRERLEAVELEDLGTGARHTLECDTVVFTGDWIPENELIRLGGLELDPATHGPRVDMALRTSAPGVFAAGNVLHGAETSDVAALEGRHVATAVAEWLRSRSWTEARIPLRVQDPITWISPNAVSPDATRAPAGHFTLRVNRFVVRALVEVRQGGRLLWRGRPQSGAMALYLPWLPTPLSSGSLVPNRPVHVSDKWCADVRLDGEEVVVALAGGT